MSYLPLGISTASGRAMTPEKNMTTQISANIAQLLKATDTTAASAQLLREAATLVKRGSSSAYISVPQFAEAVCQVLAHIDSHPGGEDPFEWFLSEFSQARAKNPVSILWAKLREERDSQQSVEDYASCDCDSCASTD